LQVHETAQDGKDLEQRPAWLDDEPELKAVLNNFIDKLDRQPAGERVRMPSLKLNRSNAPKLYNHDEASDRSWDLMQSLQGIIYSIRLDRKRSPYDAEYVGASLTMLENAEATCRAWLNRPAAKSYQQEWAEALDYYQQVFADHGEALRLRPVKISGQSAQAIVAAFASIADLKQKELTLRQLSASCFWGHSKVLDAKEQQVRQLFPSIRIKPRPVIAHVRLPKLCRGVLFIENQDSYIQALAGFPEQVKDLVIVYASGYRSSAERIRTSSGVSLHYAGDSGAEIKKSFESWWFEHTDPLWPLWFWGDLDFSGMAILKALRRVFGDIQAWPAGYAPLLEKLREGAGHSPDMADKSEQQDPGQTGCSYADEILLAAIRKYARFVDQESV
jgi:hypothetical protein